MIKKSLYKIFYAATPQEFQAEYQSRFENEDTIHLNLTIGGYPAFICQIPELYQRMLSIERTNHKVDALCHALPEIALEQFQERPITLKAYTAPERKSAKFYRIYQRNISESDLLDWFRNM